MIDRVLWGIAITGVVAGTALRVVPPPTPDAALAVVPALAPPDPPSVVSDGSGVVAANIFAPSRTAPPRRVPRRGADRPAAAPAAPAITLYGTTVTAADAFALIEADPQIAGAEIYRVGDLVQGARLVTITDSTATLASPSGGVPRVLRLPPSPALRRSM